MKRKIIHTKKAPLPIGAYNQGIVTNGFVFTAGQVAIDPATGNLIEGSFKDRVRQVMKNLNSILEEAGTNFSRVTKFTVFLTDMSNYAAVNKVFSEFIKESNAPARSLVAVSALPAGTDVEIECIATV
ncbi:MAG TPA: RidA family protein [Candidatus Marinimicrobia bacterium]|nr:RidA family protein [Candidatus Neomarinimicrobiota bacterium]HIM26627.1 RidA family protein [Candidatus Neomarinimicrobiota bacterium]HIN26627.1 RidA family protein [Candidatus Neomarinimicrobiota bacterium]